MDRNGNAPLEALGKVIAFHHPGHRIAGSQLDHAACAQRIAPLGVIAHFGTRRVQHFAGLLIIGFGIDFDLLTRERRTGRIAPAWIADHGGEVADQKDNVMPHILKLAHFIEHHGVPQVNIGSSGIQAELDAQRRACVAAVLQLDRKFRLNQQLVAAAQNSLQVVFHFRTKGCFGC